VIRQEQGKELIMKVVTPKPVLECTLKDFWDQYWSKERLGGNESLEDATKVFSGKSEIKPAFRIPSADGRSDIFFDNREMLCRFANFPTPTQGRILNAIRRALAEAEVDNMVITIPWSKTGDRKVRVRASGDSLDFETRFV
jgi:hypothetical protein